MRTAIIILNWNGINDTRLCLDALSSQDLKPTHTIIVDNGSTDGSVDVLRTGYPDIILLAEPLNHGFAGGVNIGIACAIELGCQYVALLNNDAIANTDWFANLIAAIKDDPHAGIVTGKLISSQHEYLDSTGELYTSWGLPFARGREETALTKYDSEVHIFGATGGASLYRVSMLQEIGLFDEAFFAYYEDVDISFRAQLAGWKITFVPSAVAYHKIGATSSKIKGFTTYQTLKNLPLLLWKNLPRKYLFKVLWRFKVAYILFFISAFQRGHGWWALKGLVMSFWLWPKKLKERRAIQKTMKVTPEYIWSIMTHDLPPNAHKLRKLRSLWWRLVRRVPDENRR